MNFDALLDLEDLIYFICFAVFLLKTLNIMRKPLFYCCSIWDWCRWNAWYG